MRGAADDVGMSESRSQPGGRELALYVLDTDAGLAAFREHVDAIAANVDLASGTDPDEAIELAAAEGVDAVVVEPAAIDQPAALAAEYEGLETETPLVIHTDDDQAAVPDSLQEQAATTVRKDQEGDAGRFGFLLRKVRTLVGHPVARYELEPDPEEVLSSATDQVVVHLDEDGRVIAQQPQLEALFPAAVDIDEDSPLHGQLESVFANGGEVAAQAWAEGSPAEPVSGVLCELETESGMRLYEYRSHPLTDDRETERVVVIRDVTEKSDWLKQLRRNETLVEYANDGLYTLDETGHIAFLNQSFADMLGYEPEELRGKHGQEVLVEGELERGQRAVQQLIEDPDTDSVVQDMIFETRDGAEREMSIHFTALPGGMDAYSGIMAVIRDVTERRRRERQLLQYRTLVEAAADPMYVLDTEGNFELLNEAMAEFLGEPADAVEGENVRELVPDAGFERGTETLSELLDEGRDQGRYAMWSPGPDDDERYYECTIGVIRNDDGEFVGSVGSFRDITDRKEREEELDLLKQILTRVLRHNVRNELSVIRGSVEVIAEEVSDDLADIASRARERCAKLLETSEKAREIERVIDSEVEPRPVSLAVQVEEALSVVREEYPEADVESDVPTDLEVQATSGIRIALQNLVENGIVHGQQAEDATSTEPVRVAARRKGETVVITVTDDGPGIPRSEVDVLRQSGETALEHGSGLGLWLAYWVVSKLHGEMEFDGTDGTEVEIRLPAA